MDKKIFTKQIDELIFYLDDVNGAKLCREISKEDERAIDSDEELRGAFLALQFLIIPFLSTKEIASLLKEYLTVGLMIDDLNLRERITKKLILLDLSDRDNCKNTLRQALLDNQEIITDEMEARGKKIKTTADWLRDYLSQAGSGSTKALDQAKYFYEQRYVADLNEDDKIFLKKIFNLYKFLNTSSLTPEGFEDDILLKDKDGRLITTNKGKVMVLYDPKKIKQREATAMPKKVVNIKGNNQLEELKQLAVKYPAGSFERKAIEEEIGKMNNE
ncbi:MAG: hypothetical protein PHF50_03560 [Patescibacteria group bacterium]|nr:hypothetical protein [Patescibacteria group bacterium]